MVNEIGYIFLFAGAIMVVFRLLKQPMIPAFVLSGVLIGPLFLGLVHHPHEISELSEIAVVVMLFIIGTEMDPIKLRLVGPVATIGGLIQVVATTAVGYFLAKSFGFSSVASSYIGLVTAFSSTMLAVKVMGEKHDLDSMYGRITIGILVMQDVLAIFALAILATVNNLSFDLVINTVTAVSGLILLVVFVGGIYIFPKLFDLVSDDKELLFGSAMAILFFVSFWAENQGLSLGIGSFLAGLSLSRLAYKYEIVGDLKPLKSFFAILFFAALGLQLVPAQEGGDSAAYLAGSLIDNWEFILLMLAILIVIKPFMIMCIVAMFGYRRSTCFDVGSSLGQGSEFGLLLVASGISQGHLESDLLSPIIVIIVLSMTISSYAMGFQDRMYKIFRDRIGWVERLRLSIFCHEETVVQTDDSQDGFKVVLVGRDRLGKIIELALRELKVKYLVVDSNPSVITKLRKEGVPCIFGDATNSEVLEHINFAGVEVVFSAIPRRDDNETLIQHITKTGKGKTNFIAIVDSTRDAEILYGLGAHYVLVPYVLAAMQLIHNRGESGASLDSLLNKPEDTRTLGQRHREMLAGEIMQVLGILQDAPVGDPIEGITKDLRESKS